MKEIVEFMFRMVLIYNVQYNVDFGGICQNIDDCENIL